KKKKYEENDEEAKAKEIQEEMEALNEVVMGEMDRVIIENKDNFLSKLLTASKDVEIPEAPKDENGNIIDSLFQYKYYKAHFFDNIDFSDNRLLRTPFVETKLKQYFTALPQIPDSLLPLIDNILLKAQADSTVFQFTLSFLFNHFLKSNIMGMDKVYVHIGEKYYLSGLAPWADSSFISKLSDRVGKIKPNLIGNTCPDLRLVTVNNQWLKLHDVKAKFTILLFWEPSCGHCKKAIPKLYETYKKYKENGVAVFAVYTQFKKEEWTEFLEEKSLDWINVYDPYNISNFRDLYDIYSTPVIYLLDEDKKIVAKRLGAEDIEDFLSREFN
ncbi:redoxin domain-containing protein, partial [Bacteroidota bacterium]